MVASVAQQNMRLHDSPAAYRKELVRFLGPAREKGATLVVFPALAGLLIAGAGLEGVRMKLLKQADEGAGRKRKVVDRARRALAESAAQVLGASVRDALRQSIGTRGDALAQEHDAFWSSLAEEFGVTLVGGTALLPDENGILRHRASVYGPDGTLLGRHDATSDDGGPLDRIEAGETWRVIETPAGRLGLLIAEEALYPEVGRVLAYQGADLLIVLAAVQDPLAAYVRQGALALAQANALFAAVSFQVGRNRLSLDETVSFAGRSAILAPLEMTPRYTGIMAEMGTARSDGLVSAELDCDRLHSLWHEGAAPVRRRMPSERFARELPALYGAGLSLAEAWSGDREGERDHSGPELVVAQEETQIMALEPARGPTVEFAEPAAIGCEPNSDEVREDHAASETSVRPDA
jgi:predicted amidohydrolase